MSQHPYYARSDYPPYKLRETIWWVTPLLPLFGLACLALKASGFRQPGYLQKNR